MKKGINIMMLIFKVLQTHSSKQNPLTRTKIFQILENDYKTIVDRHGITPRMVNTALDGMIKMQSEMNSDEKTICYKSNKEGTYRTNYYINNQISDIELKFLIDSIMYSKVFNSIEAQNLARKVQLLSGKELENITNYIKEDVFGKQRNMTGINVLENIQNIEKALNENRYIEFDFYNFDLLNDKITLKIRHKDAVLYPLQLVIYDGRYVLIAKYPNNDKKYHFNVDFIKNVRLKEVNLQREKTDIFKNNVKRSNYMLEHPYFMSGDACSVKLRVDRKYFSRIVDTFSHTIKVESRKKKDATVDIWVKSSIEGIVKFLVANYDIVELLSENKEIEEKLVIAIHQLNNKYKDLIKKYENN